MIKRIAYLFFILCSAKVYSQHTPFYSQYLFNPQAINPANAGYNEVLDVSLVHRRQWIEFSGAPQTTEFNLHTALKNKKMNIGAKIQNDQYGVTKNNSASLIYAYRVFFSKTKHLSFGADAGFGQTMNDWTKINTTTGGDPVYSTSIEKNIFGKISFGIVFRDSSFSIGFSVPDIYQSTRRGIINERQFLYYGEYRYRFNEHLSVNPSILLKHVKNSPLAFDINTVLTYNEKYSIGAGYRINDAFLMLFRAKINYQFEIGYAYDLTLSPIKTYSNGTHEVLLRYVFAYPVNATRPRN